MKKVLVLLAAALIAVGCGESRKLAEASLVAEEFISAYTSGDFEHAGALCSDFVKKRVDAAAVILSPLDSNVRASAISTTSALKWEKEVVDDGDESVVTLRYSTCFEEKHVFMTFKLSQTDTGSWTIIWME